MSRVAFLGAVAVLLCLAALHVLSPEFDPSWRMVSEYANGSYGWLLSLMFVCWAVSTWALAAALKPFLHSRAGTIGWIVLLIAGVGEMLAAIFDINHSLHGLAGALGILGLPLAAMLLGISLSHLATWKPIRPLVLLLSNLTWLSVVLMAFAMFQLFSQLSAIGYDMTAPTTSTSTLPDEVHAFVGWANRFLIVAYCAWAMGMAWGARNRSAS
ncbi:MAG: DUF998 domain-containing protein [Gemmatimonadaceae bacterium]|nr:DUF998 domain-containing protein [Gemmatimonadaceae bacterium]